MAAYVKLTNFASKDGLLSGNPLKVVTGAELDDEFNALASSSQLNYDALNNAVDAAFIKWDFSSTTSMADPGSGIIRFNNAAAASTTAIAIDDLNNDGADVSAYVISWDDSTGSTNRGTLTLKQGNIFAIFSVTGLTDNSGWTQLAVTYVTGSGTFVSGTETYVSFYRTGEASTDVSTVAGIAADVTTVAGVASDVTTVATNNANVTTVATNIANVNTVGTNIANVNTVGGISANVTTVAGISGNVTTVAGISANVTTVAGISGNVTTVAGISSDVTAVAGIASDVSAVAAQFIGWNFSTTTSMADPGSGIMRFNNATIASVTAIAFDDNNSAAADVSAYVLTWDDATSTDKGTLTIRQGTANYAIFSVTGLTDNAGWTEVAVTHVSSSGSFSNATLTFVDFDRTGDAGTGDMNGPAASVDSEIALFDSTTGKVLKRATTTGILKATSGVLSAATAGTDYAKPATASSWTAAQTFDSSMIKLKGSSTGVSTFAAANTSATDYTVTVPAETMTIGYKNIPAVGTKTGSYTLATGDVGKYVQLGSGGAITIPDATFAEGDVVSIVNNTASTATITCTITTAYISGTDSDKATMTLAARGICTIFFLSGTVCVVNGSVT